MNNGYLKDIRTAATGVVATRYLAVQDAGMASAVGTGAWAGHIYQLYISAARTHLSHSLKTGVAQNISEVK